jgi:hypothetical protein
MLLLLLLILNIYKSFRYAALIDFKRTIGCIYHLSATFFLARASSTATLRILITFKSVALGTLSFLHKQRLTQVFKLRSHPKRGD